MLCVNIMCLQTAVPEESNKNVKDLKNILDSVREDIKREIKDMTRTILKGIVHHEAKDVRDPPGGKNHSKDKHSSLAAKRHFTASEGELNTFYLTKLRK